MLTVGSMSVTLIVIVAVSVSDCRSSTSTTSEYDARTSKSSAALTVISPVEALIANAPPVFPERMLHVRISPGSGSAALAVPTDVPTAASSGTANVSSSMIGAALVMETVSKSLWLTACRPPLNATLDPLSTACFACASMFNTSAPVWLPPSAEKNTGPVADAATLTVSSPRSVNRFNTSALAIVSVVPPNANVPPSTPTVSSPSDP